MALLRAAAAADLLRRHRRAGAGRAAGAGDTDGAAAGGHASANRVVAPRREPRRMHWITDTSPSMSPPPSYPAGRARTVPTGRYVPGDTLYDGRYLHLTTRIS